MVFVFMDFGLILVVLLFRIRARQLKRGTVSKIKPTLSRLRWHESDRSRRHVSDFKKKQETEKRKRFKTFKREIFKMLMKTSEEAFTQILSEINKYAAQFQLWLSHRTTQSIVGSDWIGSCFWLIPVMTRVIWFLAIFVTVVKVREWHGWRSVSRSVVSDSSEEQRTLRRTDVGLEF